jgi:fumarate hydratase class II
MGNNVAISVSGTHGHFELNVFKVSLLCIHMLVLHVHRLLLIGLHVTSAAWCRSSLAVLSVDI